jgi:hypothetical protein
LVLHIPSKTVDVSKELTPSIENVNKNVKILKKIWLDEAAESCTIDGESPVVESLKKTVHPE